MCPLYPFHLVLLYLCLLLPLLFAVVEGAEEFLTSWKLDFLPKNVSQLMQYDTHEARVECTGCEGLPSDLSFLELRLRLISGDPVVASITSEDADQTHEYDQVSWWSGQEKGVTSEIVFDLSAGNGASVAAALAGDASNWSLPFNITGNFLGYATVKAELWTKPEGPNVLKSAPAMPVEVIRKKTVASKMFAYSVALLVSVAYINMGCAMDLGAVKESLRRPVGPLIGFVCQFLIMPLISFALGFFFTSTPMRLGLFVTGTSPGGGASNMWTLMFGGNLDLSITMTAVSTLAAFFMMPLWVFSLGRLIPNDEHVDMVIPYSKLCTYAVCLAVPLLIGLLISKYLPRVSKFLVRILKPFSLFLILFILIFGVWANLYMFKLMNLSVWLAGMGLPWLGFAFGCTIARLLGRSAADVTAIAIETGVQNTGVSIFFLWFTFQHPMGDIAAVIPVAAATMTPFPLLAVLGLMKLRECYDKRYGAVATDGDNSSDEVDDVEKHKPIYCPMAGIASSNNSANLANSESSQKLIRAAAVMAAEKEEVKA